MKLVETEHELQNKIISYLQYKHYKVLRMNSGAIRSLGSNGKTFMTRLQEPGTPDLLALKDGKAIFFEIKTPKNHPTTLQKMKMDELERYGCHCFVIHSLEEMQAII